MADAKALPQSGEDKSKRPGNLSHLVSWRGRLIRCALAFSMGALSSIMFAPLEWSWASWIVLVPLLLMVERRPRGHWWTGYWWGAGHFIFCLYWLKEVIPPAPFGVGLICAVFPATFAWAAGWVLRYLRWKSTDDLEPKNGKKPLPAPLPSPAKQVLLVCLLAALWCTVEWIRAWFYTGFPWNQFGVSQWSNSLLLPMVAFTGVYGLSFLIAAVNAGVFLAILPWLRKERTRRQTIPVGLIFGVVLVAAVALFVPKPTVPEPSKTLAVACIQGNIPQMRVPTIQQGELAKTVYHELTRAAWRSTTPDLIVWPETALPWPMFMLNMERNGPAIPYLRELIEQTQIPMLIGSLDYRVDGDRVLNTYNSAILVDVTAARTQTYDKMKAVPFGEFLPFVDFYPGWLKRFLQSKDLFMRSLTTGTDYTVFHYKDARMGVNICYEDIFPEVSRNLVLNGANVLVTITNDAWYNKTSGSHQHMVHAVFRAVETGRPMLRSGNNSDTCLILPDGSVTERLVGPNGNPFYRGFKIYHVPLWDNLPATFYLAHGNLFVWCLAGITLVTLVYCTSRFLSARQRILDKTKAETS